MKKFLVSSILALMVISIGSIVFASSLGHSGKVVFGTGYKKANNQLAITHLQDTFSLSHPNSRIVYVAYLKQTAKKGLKNVISELSPKAHQINSGPVNSKAFGNDEIENDFTISQAKNSGMGTAGTYQFAYYQGGTNVAKGSVKLVK